MPPFSLAHRAYRKKALSAHPDKGGDPEVVSTTRGLALCCITATVV